MCKNRNTNINLKRAVAFISASNYSHPNETVSTSAFSSESSLRYYQIYHKLRFFIKPILCLYMFLAFFERPSDRFYKPPSSNDSTSQISYTNNTINSIINVEEPPQISNATYLTHSSYNKLKVTDSIKNDTNSYSKKDQYDNFYDIISNTNNSSYNHTHKNSNLSYSYNYNNSNLMPSNNNNEKNDTDNTYSSSKKNSNDDYRKYQDNKYEHSINKYNDNLKINDRKKDNKYKSSNLPQVSNEYHELIDKNNITTFFQMNNSNDEIKNKRIEKNLFQDKNEDVELSNKNHLKNIQYNKKKSKFKEFSTAIQDSQIDKINDYVNYNKMNLYKINNKDKMSSYKTDYNEIDQFINNYGISFKEAINNNFTINEIKNNEANNNEMKVNEIKEYEVNKFENKKKNDTSINSNKNNNKSNNKEKNIDNKNEKFYSNHEDNKCYNNNTNNTNNSMQQKRKGTQSRRDGWKSHSRWLSTQQHTLKPTTNNQHLSLNNINQNNIYRNSYMHIDAPWAPLFVHQEIYVHLLEILCLTFIGIYKLCEYYSHNMLPFHQKLLIMFIIFSIIDNTLSLFTHAGIMSIISYIIHTFINNQLFTHTLHISRILRPIIFGLYIASLRSIITGILRTLYKVHNIFAAIILSILLFDWWGIIFFTGTIGHQQFGSFSRGFLSLLMMLSSANFREVLLPGYASHPAASIFFVFFYLVVEILLLGLLTASLYSVYREEHGNNLFKTLKNRELYIKTAFDLICNENNYITYEQWDSFYKEYSKLTLSNYSSKILLLIGMQAQYINHELTSKKIYENALSSKDINMSIKDFSRAFSILTNQGFHDLANQFDSSNKSKKIITKILFSNILVDIILLLGIFLTFLQTLEGNFNIFEIIYNYSIFSPTFAQAFVSFSYSLIIIGRVYLHGFHYYWHNQTLYNRFDLSLALAVLPLQIYITIRNFYFPIYFITWPDRCLHFLRVYGGIRLLFRFHGFNKMITSLFSVLRAFYTVLGLLLLVFYIYATLGNQIFGGLIECRIPQNKWEICDSCILNFNEFLSALITLFILMVNGWDSSLEVIFDHISPTWCALYFTSFYFFTDTIVLNLFVALTLEAFEQVNKIDSGKCSFSPATDNDIQVIDTEEVQKQIFQEN